MFQDKVYAVDSLEHMTMGNTTLYEISQDGSMNVIYDVGYSFWMEENDVEEEMGYRIKYAGEALYIMIAGAVVHKVDHKLRFESRILKIEGSEIKEVYVIPEIYEEVSDLIVYNDTAYIAADKMLSVVDLQTMESKYYTFLSSKALHNLRKNNKEKNNKMESRK